MPLPFEYGFTNFIPRFSDDSPAQKNQTNSDLTMHLLV